MNSPKSHKISTVSVNYNRLPQISSASVEDGGSAEVGLAVKKYLSVREPGVLVGSWKSLGYRAEWQNQQTGEQFVVEIFPDEETARRGAESEIRRRLTREG
jgi:hypothetical protein